MAIEKNTVLTQDELNEKAPMDQIEDRVEAKMKKIEGNAKQSVGEGLQNSKLAEEGDRLKQEGENELKKARKSGG
jgi:uncharacterized protein YjbJ (UPF0337 family)